MPHRLTIALLSLCLSALSIAPLSIAPLGAREVHAYLPAGATYDAAIPTPESVLGWHVGEWHVRPEQIQRYAEIVAEASDRVTLEVTGWTHEKRPVMLLTITHPDNHARLDEIRRQHLAIGDPSQAMPSETELGRQPAVVWLVYSVHGDEASGANAGLPVLYHLAAAQGSTIETLLRETVILIDPQVNPDGGARFATWANMHKGKVLVGDPEHREHVQGWPSGRTNHYWYDLNRDWLLLQHPESRARVETFQRWRPHVLGDYHEMGRASTYFFQPGVPERINPLIPERNQRITHALAEFHARALDRHGRLYYSGETFDDFYPGKGSTYPDLNGAVGVLFEQASARGHLQDTPNGPLSFETAVHNQVLTSLSLIEGTHDQRRELLDYRRWFADDASTSAQQDATAAYVFAEPRDPARIHHMLDLLRRHGLEVHRLQRDVTLDDERRFDAASAFIVPVDQVGYRLVKSLFEVQTAFDDDVFYDVSTWTLPLAFGIDFAPLSRTAFSTDLLGEAVDTPASKSGRAPSGMNRRAPSGMNRRAPSGPAVAYAFEWHGYYAPRALYTLLDEGFEARTTLRPFSARTQSGVQDFDYGTIVLPVGLQGGRADALEQRLEDLATRDGIDVYALTSGLTPAGVDLGSPSVRPLETPRVLLVVGPGVSPYAAGEMWHLLDERFSIPVAHVELDRLHRVDLDDYSHVLMPEGRYGGASKAVREALKSWVRRGGTLVATQNAALWVDRALTESALNEPTLSEPGLSTPNGPPTPSGAPSAGLDRPPAPRTPLVTSDGQSGTQSDMKPDMKSDGQSDASLMGGLDGPPRRRYLDYERERAAQLIGGAMLQTRLDLTHPMAFGISRPELAVFRTHSSLLSPSDNPYETFGVYTAQPWLSGYVSPRNVERLANQTAMRAQRFGDGAIIQLADNPTFRGYWLGGQKLILNAIFFGPTIKTTSAPYTWE